jgi:hypothetical protein
MCLALAATRVRAQTFDATNLREPTDLAATWLVHAGDDPAYARPDFDDSQWLKFDTTKDLRDLFPHSHPEIVWYRLRVKVAPAQAGLALKEVNISSAFEVYSGGVLLMKLGQVKPFDAYTALTPLVNRIPESQIATGLVVLALRVRITPKEWGRPGPGFVAENLTLGREHELTQDVWLTMINRYAADRVLELLFVSMGLVALAFFFAQRKRREYLWFALQVFLIPFGWLFDPGIHNYRLDWFIGLRLISVTESFFNLLMYFAFLRLRFGWWMRLSFVAAAALTVYHHFIDSSPVAPPNLLDIPFFLVTVGLIPLLLVLHLRRGNREAGILLIPSILGSLSTYALLTVWFLPKFPHSDAINSWILRLEFWKIGPFSFSLFNVSGLLSLLSLIIIIAFRTSRMSRQQTVLEGEMEAARQVQQVILPEAVETVPGFTIESVYQPAQQVGGDFFQILPDGEGGLLVVVGDVAGKGLPAAMLVSVLVGAVRTAAAYSRSPDEVLAQLNKRLVGRGGSLSTALVARIAANGSVTIANAGHLSPYLDGREVELPGALPLGVISGASYETIQFQLASGSRLTFYSDGVIEAQNQKGELFGFDRARDLSTQSAAAIVEAARQFGQSDDITVVAIERNAVGEEAKVLSAAPALAPA